ncbi:MAG: HIT family protein [Gammaproteobacteria bacterium]|nr:HIT family protein [Gammaproteobacteria bacterium]
MSDTSDCIFCRIVRGEIPSFQLYEDEHSLAFMDINPANQGHALAIPKRHSENLFTIDPEDLAHTAQAAQRVAIAIHKSLAPAGINLVQANGPAAGQSVFHFHMHIMPRIAGDELKLNWGMYPGDMEAIGNLAKRITDAM